MKNCFRLLPPAPHGRAAGNLVGRGKYLLESGKWRAAAPSCKTSNTPLYCEQSKRHTQYIVLCS